MVKCLIQFLRLCYVVIFHWWAKAWQIHGEAARVWNPKGSTFPKHSSRIEIANGCWLLRSLWRKDKHTWNSNISFNYILKWSWNLEISIPFLTKNPIACDISDTFHRVNRNGIWSKPVAYPNVDQECFRAENFKTSSNEVFVSPLSSVKNNCLLRSSWLPMSYIL